MGKVACKNAVQSTRAPPIPEHGKVVFVIRHDIDAAVGTDEATCRTEVRLAARMPVDREGAQALGPERVHRCPST